MYDVKRVVRDERFKLYSTVEFFDLFDDPLEANNLDPRHELFAM